MGKFQVLRERYTLLLVWVGGVRNMTFLRPTCIRTLAKAGMVSARHAPSTFKQLGSGKGNGPTIVNSSTQVKRSPTSDLQS